MSRSSSALVIAAVLAGLCAWGTSAWAFSGSMGDCVWYDANADGIPQANEHGIDGVTVTLYRMRSDGTFSTTPFIIAAVPNPATTGTKPDGYYSDQSFTEPAADGWYIFPQVPAGTYKVVVSNVPAGYVPTYDLDDGVLDGINDTPNTAIFVCTGMADRLDVDFGYVEAPDTAFCTFTQGGWGAKPAGGNAGALLRDNWNTVYGGNGLTVGSSPYTLHFNCQAEVTAFLPQGGIPAALTQSWNPPTQKLSVLAGQVVALRLNLDFSNAGIIQSGIGARVIQEGQYAGQTVSQFVLLAEQALGNPASGLDVGEINDTATMINESFVDGTTNTGFLK